MDLSRPTPSSLTSSSFDDTHWLMYRLPPFFTLQPVPATLQKQLRMWSTLLLEHALVQSSSAVAPSECRCLRLYTPSSEVFTQPQLHRTLPASAAEQVLEYAAEHFPSHCALLSSDSINSKNTLLVSCVHGGFDAQESALYNWILTESSNATTSTDLAKSGVVMTFDEMVEEKVLYHSQQQQQQQQQQQGSSSDCSGSRSASQWDASRLDHILKVIPEEAKSRRSGTISDESALRALMQHLSHRQQARTAAVTLQSYRITMFNADGGDEPPYEGVKIGGGGGG